MNGADHYREAERLVENVKESVEKSTPINVDDVMAVAAPALAAAQVHATLALAAATAADAASKYDGNGHTRGREWAGVA